MSRQEKREILGNSILIYSEKPQTPEPRVNQS